MVVLQGDLTDQAVNDQEDLDKELNSTAVTKKCSEDLDRNRKLKSTVPAVTEKCAEVDVDKKFASANKEKCLKEDKKLKNTAIIKECEEIKDIDKEFIVAYEHYGVELEIEDLSKKLKNSATTRKCEEIEDLDKELNNTAAFRNCEKIDLEKVLNNTAASKKCVDIKDTSRELNNISAAEKDEKINLDKKLNNTSATEKGEKIYLDKELNNTSATEKGEKINLNKELNTSATEKGEKINLDKELNTSAGEKGEKINLDKESNTSATEKYLETEAPMATESVPIQLLVTKEDDNIGSFPACTTQPLTSLSTDLPELNKTLCAAVISSKPAHTNANNALKEESLANGDLPCATSCQHSSTMPDAKGVPDEEEDDSSPRSPDASAAVGADEETATKAAPTKTKKKEDKSIEYILRALSSLSSPEEKLAALCKKYADLHEEHRVLQSSFKQQQRRMNVVQREKDQLQAEHTKAIIAKSKLESLCRELQKHNKVIKEESLQRVKEEDERRREISARFQTTIGEIQQQMNENHEKNVKLREENVELAGKLKKFIEQYEIREQQVEKLMKHRELEQQLSDTRLQQAAAILKEEQERNMKEKELLVLQATENHKKSSVIEAQLMMYKERYEEFQSTINKSNDMFLKLKSEMDKMGKRIKKLEKEGAQWKAKWESSNKALIDMAEEKTRTDKDKQVLQTKVQKLESLCRALQAELHGKKLATPCEAYPNVSLKGESTMCDPQPNLPEVPFHSCTDCVSHLSHKQNLKAKRHQLPRQDATPQKQGAIPQQIEKQESASQQKETQESASSQIEKQESASQQIVEQEFASLQKETQESASPQIEKQESASQQIVEQEFASLQKETQESASPQIEKQESASPQIEQESASPQIEQESAPQQIKTQEFAALQIESQDSVTQWQVEPDTIQKHVREQDSVTQWQVEPDTIQKHVREQDSVTQWQVEPDTIQKHVREQDSVTQWQVEPDTIQIREQDSVTQWQVEPDTIQKHVREQDSVTQWQVEPDTIQKHVREQDAAQQQLEKQDVKQPQENEISPSFSKEETSSSLLLLTDGDPFQVSREHDMPSPVDTSTAISNPDQKSPNSDGICSSCPSHFHSSGVEMAGKESQLTPDNDTVKAPEAVTGSSPLNADNIV